MQRAEAKRDWRGALDRHDDSSLSPLSQEQSVPISVLSQGSKKTEQTRRKDGLQTTRKDEGKNEGVKGTSAHREEREKEWRGAQTVMVVNIQGAVGQGNLSKTDCCLPDWERRGCRRRVDTCRVNYLVFFPG